MGKSMNESISGYINWLLEEKEIGTKSAHDYASRLKRAIQLIGDKQIDTDILDVLNNTEGFILLSVSVKSQIRRAVKLYLEYNEK